MFSVCKQILEQDKLEQSLQEYRDAESKFNSEIGVKSRMFYQCIQQPHIIWANTEWVSEGAHNKAAAAIMKVRKDDRVAAAYFRPGLYFEIFTKRYENARIKNPTEQKSRFVVVCHGMISDKFRDENWEEKVSKRIADLTDKSGLLRCEIFYNYYGKQEFVAFLEWSNDEAYRESRSMDDRTVEEQLFVGDKPYELSSYIQYECNPLSVKN